MRSRMTRRWLFNCWMRRAGSLAPTAFAVKDGVKLNLRYATNMRDVFDTWVVAQDMFREVGIGVG